MSGILDVIPMEEKCNKKYNDCEKKIDNFDENEEYGDIIDTTLSINNKINFPKLLLIILCYLNYVNYKKNNKNKILIKSKL
jgi:hypothetical protein